MTLTDWLYIAGWCIGGGFAIGNFLGSVDGLDLPMHWERAWVSLFIFFTWPAVLIYIFWPTRKNG